MKTDGFARAQVDHRRARIAPQCRAVVLQFVRPDVGDLTGREALLLVDVAEDSLDEPLIGHSWVPRGITDGDDEVVGRDRLRERNRRGEPAIRQLGA